MNNSRNILGYIRNGSLALLMAVSLIVPTLALAATTPDTASNQVTNLYTELVQLLEQELALLENPTQSGTATSLSIYPTSGVAPLFVTFVVNNPTGYESINYGNGRTTGSDGCVKNAEGWCDLTKPVANEYPIPGTYTVMLYRHTSSTTVQYLSTSTIDVLAPTSTQYDPNL